MDLITSLQQAIARSGQSLYAVAKGSGADYSVLLRFMADERDIRLETASRVADYLGLELRSARGKSRRRRKGGR